MEVGYKWVPPIWSECIQFLFCIIFELPFKKTNFVIFYLLKVRIHPAILKTVNNRGPKSEFWNSCGGVYFENLMSSTNILLGHFIFLCITYILVLVYHFLYELLVSNALIDPISLFLGRSRVETIIVPYFPIQAYVLASYRSFRQHIFGTEFQFVIGMVRQGFLLQRT